MKIIEYFLTIIQNNLLYIYNKSITKIINNEIIMFSWQEIVKLIYFMGNWSEVQLLQ